MDLDFKKKDYFFIAAIAVSVLLWAFFLNSVSLSLTQIVRISLIWETIGKIKSIEFILFILLFPLTYAFTVLFCKKNEKKLNVMLGTAIGLIIGLGLSYALFSNISELVVAGILYFLSFFLIIELTYTRLKELKKYISFRLLKSGASRSITITAVGLFIASALILIPMQEQLVEEMEEDIIDVALVQQGSAGLSEQAADLLVQSHQVLLAQLTDMEIFESLKSSPDPNAVAYATIMENTKTELSSPEYKQKIKNELLKAQEKILSREQTRAIFDQLKEKMPIYGLLTDFLWLLESFVLASIFLLIGNIIISPLTIIYGLIIEQITKPRSTKTKKTEK